MSLPAFVFPGAYAVLTGAASGMGEQMALQLAERGTHLVLIDRDAERLEDVAARIRAARPDVEVHLEVADLAETAAIPGLVEGILSASPRVDLLINNAGVALGGAFADLSADEFDWVMAINFAAPVALCRGLLPALRRAEVGHIVNVSSVFGLIGPPGQAAYSSSKFALRGFSEVLRQELAPVGIGVTTVHPGGIRTRIAQTARIAARATPEQARAGQAAFAKLLTYPADKAATEILEAVAHRRSRILIASSARIPDLLSRLLPVRHAEVLRVLQRGGRGRAARTTARTAAREQG